MENTKIICCALCAIEREIGRTPDALVDIVVDIIDRIDLEKYASADDDDRYDLVNCAIDDEMIYTDDQWTVYRWLCQMGDPAEEMWDRLYNLVSVAVKRLTEEDRVTV